MVGLSVALELARRGLPVELLEREAQPGQGASAAAAGMLAVGVEAGEGGPFMELCRSSRELWPGWAEGLLEESGVDCELDRSGLVRVACDGEGRDRLERFGEAQRGRGIEVSPLLEGGELARLVPGLGPAVLAGLHFPQDWHVHTHRLLEALQEACRRRGVAISAASEVAAVEEAGEGVSVRLSSGEERRADRAVVCAGSWSGRLLGLPVEPVRGQIVATDPGRPVLPRILFGDHVYLLQKRSGLVLAGSSEERAGFRPFPTAGWVAELIRSALELLPGLAEFRFAYAWAGLRPHLGRGWPVLGRVHPGGPLLVATAHYRNGVLLAPLTARLIATAALGEVDPPELADFSPAAAA